MRRLALLVCAVLALAMPPTAPPAHAQGRTEAASPVGRWLTYDNRGGRKRAIIQIEPQGGVLVGRIVSTTDPADARKVCTKCGGARHDQPIIGLPIITGMHRDGARWDGGHILDPETGSVYRCILRVEDHGQRLVVRGFIGLSLFGGSQTWTRVG